MSQPLTRRQGRRLVLYSVLLWIAMIVLAIRVEAQGAAKGVAGCGPLEEVGASWCHHWSPCREWDDDSCIDHVKARWTLETGDDFYGDINRVIDRLEACESGWFMFGDEWVYQDHIGWKDWSMANQIDELKWFVDLRDTYNPACKIAFGGILAYHPSTGLSGPPWVHEFAAAYRAEYGQLPPVHAIMMDTYDWSPFGRDYYSDTRAMVDAIREVYGSGMEVWAREVGCLMSHQCALDSVPKVRRISLLLDRHAFFVSHDPAWSYTSLWDGGWQLTDLGEAYRDMPELHYFYLPLYRISE